MTIQAQYYLNCNVCGITYPSKPDSPQDVEDEALDDGWEILDDKGTCGHGDILSTHICKQCADKARACSHI